MPNAHVVERRFGGSASTGAVFVNGGTFGPVPRVRPARILTDVCETTREL
jgi:hypothetical protein